MKKGKTMITFDDIVAYFTYICKDEETADFAKVMAIECLLCLMSHKQHKAAAADFVIIHLQQINEILDSIVNAGCNVPGSTAAEQAIIRLKRIQAVAYEFIQALEEVK